ncbi:MAG TPA: hypothetical protein VFU02_13155, partial [Polyangiaceae bacterium]|nr:hypothetical protein [Polyangiaceae bacterium]
MKPFAIPQRALTGGLPILFMVTLAAGCGGTFDEGGGDPPAPDMGDPPAPDMVGPAGGTVTPRGSAANAADAKVEVPPGALAAATAIAIEEGSTGAPALPAGLAALGAMFELTPHGTAFAMPALLTLPVPAEALPGGTRLGLYKTTAGQAGWAPVADAAVSGATISGLISSFSFAQVVAEPLPSGDLDPGCDVKVVMSTQITGMVLDPRGRPHIGHVVLRDRAINVGAIYAEASANEAGFFLLNSDGVVTSAGCKRSYVIEVTSQTAEGEKLYGELDVTSLFPVGETGETEEDITDTPVVLGV